MPEFTKTLFLSVGECSFMHIHGHGHCDICLPKDVQEQVLAEGKALRHRWAPEKGYVTSMPSYWARQTGRAGLSYQGCK
jgi:hypothetical protein